MVAPREIPPPPRSLTPPIKFMKRSYAPVPERLVTSYIDVLV